LARSRTRANSRDADSSRPGAGSAPAPSLAAATVPRVWQGIGYRPLSDAVEARPLFDYAAIPWPDREVAFAWGAADGTERLIGAVALERSGGAAMLDGEATVKTFKRSDGHVWLIPHNPAYTPILGDEATILGRVVAVLRRV